MITVRQLKKAAPEAARDLTGLMPQLSSSGNGPKITPAVLRRLIADKNLYIALVMDGRKVVGTGALVFMKTLNENSAGIEDVVIDDGYRGRGLGEQLVRHLIKIAKAKKVDSIDLTSRPSRVAANALYQKLGFEKRETNVYRLKLK